MSSLRSEVEPFPFGGFTWEVWNDDELLATGTGPTREICEDDAADYIFAWEATEGEIV